MSNADCMSKKMQQAFFLFSNVSEILWLIKIKLSLVRLFFLKPDYWFIIMSFEIKNSLTLLLIIFSKSFIIFDVLLIESKSRFGWLVKQVF